MGMPVTRESTYSVLVVIFVFVLHFCIFVAMCDPVHDVNTLFFIVYIGVAMCNSVLDVDPIYVL